MQYKLGKCMIDTTIYYDKFKKGYYLPFMKELVDLSGCSLKEVKNFIDEVLEKENITMEPFSKEIQDYCLSELNDLD